MLRVLQSKVSNEFRFLSIPPIRKECRLSEQYKVREHLQGKEVCNRHRAYTKINPWFGQINICDLKYDID